MLVNTALNAAAAAVRTQLIRLDYLEADDTPDGEDKAIACAAIAAFLNSIGLPDMAKQIPDPTVYDGT